MQYDGCSDGLFFVDQQDSDGCYLIFNRGVCDELVSFIFQASSTYAAATAQVYASKRSF